MSGGPVHWGDLEPRFAAIGERIAAIEEHLAVLSKHLGIPYAPRVADGVPPSVVALVRQGKTMDAIKEYRALTGVSIDEAREAISKI